MKKKLFKILTGLCIFAFAITVNAEVQDSATINSTETGKNLTDATVTVGTVEAPVYEVAVIWNDLTFNWVYDSETNDFGWKPVPICYNIGATEENVKMYLDAFLLANRNSEFYRNHGKASLGSTEISAKDYIKAIIEGRKLIFGKPEELGNLENIGESREVFEE